MTTVIERAIGNLAEEANGQTDDTLVTLFARAEFAAVVASNRHAITRSDVEWAFRWLRGRRVDDRRSFLALFDAWASVASLNEAQSVAAAMIPALVFPADALLAERIRAILP